MKNLIDRDSLLKNYCDLCKEFHHIEGKISEGCEDCREILVIKEQPLIQIDEKEQADWILYGYYNSQGIDVGNYQCSNCHNKRQFPLNICREYCERCGCRMIGVIKDV